MSIARRSVVAALAVLPALALAAVAGDPPRVGLAAPVFTAKDMHGRTVSLASFAGRTVVLEWTNPECPFVAKHYGSGAMQALQADARSRGVVWLTVSSAAPGQVGYLDELEAAALTDARKANPAHVLLDHDGSLLAAYAVPVALTMAVIAPDGRLAYYGAIDDKPTAKPEDIVGARNYVKAALDALARGEAPQPSQTRPYGCVPR
jgi:peroxiredoxin